MSGVDRRMRQDGDVRRRIGKTMRRLERLCTQAGSGRITAEIRRKIRFLRKRLSRLLRPQGRCSAGQSILRAVPILLMGGLTATGALAQTPKITSTAPATNATSAPLNSNIDITFSTAMDAATVGANNIFIYGSQTGFLSDDGTFSGDPTRQFNPDVNFKPGELISVSVTGATSSGGTAMNPAQQFSFYAGVKGGSGRFTGYNSGGGYTHGVALGDLDGDGDIDILVANGRYSSGGEANQIWLNNGDGTSFAVSTFGNSTGESTGVDLGDLDGDGDLDAIFCAFNQAHELWLNNGDGTFTSSLLGGGQAFGIVIGDLDSDGDLDAAMARGQFQQTEVWFNNGDATFNIAGRGGINAGFDIAMGDVNNDGFQDLFVAHIFGNSELLINDGHGNFSVGQLGGAASLDAVMGDFDGDADIDIVVANSLNDNRANQFWRNNGDGTFQVSNFGTGNTRSAATGDFDGDGDLDVLMAATASYDHHFVYINNGDGTFVQRLYNAYNNSNSYACDVGDLNNDGTIDAVVFNSYGLPNEILFNYDALTFVASKPTRNTISAPRDGGIELVFNAAVNSAGLSTSATVTNANLIAYGMQSGHLTSKSALQFSNGNKTVKIAPPGTFFPGEEIMVTVTNGTSIIGLETSQATVYGFRAAAEGGTGAFNSTSFGAGDSRGVALGDLDRDGDLDAIVANTSNSVQEVWLNNGDGTFTSVSFGSGHSTDVALGDLDGDCDLDAIIANAGGQPQDIWFNNGDGTFSTATFGAGDSRALAIGDLDGNGALDVIIANYGGAQEIWLNNGDGTFVSSSNGGGGSTDVALGDLDNDGDLDAILVNDGGDGSQMMNKGDGTFTNINITAGVRRAVVIADFNGDGNLDFVTANSSNKTLFRNNGLAVFSTQNFGLGNCSDVATGDVDGDGDHDLLVTRNGAAHEILFNNGSGSFSAATFGSGAARGLALGDLDGDGDLDAILANDAAAQDIWINQPAVPTITSLTPNSTTASREALSLDIGGTDFEQTTASLTTVDINGAPTGALNLAVSGTAGRGQFRALVPAGFVATRATLTLTVSNQSGSTTTTLIVSNDRPQIGVASTYVQGQEDQATTLNISIDDVWPGLAALTVTPPAADLTTVATITQTGATGAVTQFLVTPVQDAVGPVVLTFDISDGYLTNSTTLTLDFLPVNDAPVISTNNTTLITNEDSALSAAFTLFDVDTPYTHLIVTATSGNQSLVTNGGITVGATGATTSLDIMPVLNANGVLPIHVTVDDGEFSRSTTFNLTILAVNDPPVIAAETATLTTNEDISTATTISLNDVDTPYTGLIVTATSGNQSLVTDGGITIGATGAVTSLEIAPVPDAGGTAQLFVTVDDGEYLRTTTITLTVNPVNDAPVIGTNNTMLITNEDSAVSGSFTLYDVDTPYSRLIVTATSGNQSLVTNGGITVGATGATTSLDIMPVLNANGVLPIHVTVDDGEFSRSTTFNLTILAVNDPPVIAAETATLTTNEDISTATTISLYDVDTPFTGLIVTATSGNHSLVTDGGITIGVTSAVTSLEIAPVPDAGGTAQLFVTVDDGEYLRTTTITLTVNPVNDVPVIGTNNTMLITNEDSAVSAAFTLSDVDTPYNRLIVTATSGNQSLVTNGGITVGATGATTSLDIVPVLNANGVLPIHVTVDDGEFSRSTTFNLTILAVNDPPHISLAVAHITMDENGTSTTTIHLSDVDTPFNKLLVTARSADQALLTDAKLVPGTTAATIDLSMTPVCGASGSTLLTVSVVDGAHIRTTSLILNVRPIDALSIDGPANGCPGVLLRYSALPADARAVHSWTVEGGTIRNGQGTGSIEVLWDVVATVSTIDLTRSYPGGCTTSTRLIADPRNIQALTDFVVATKAHIDVPVLLNDSGDDLILLSVEDPAGGTAVVSSGNVVYTPDAGFSGVEVFNYVAQSAQGCTATGALVVAVPTAVDADPMIQFVESQHDRTGNVRGLKRAEAAVVSPDGRFVYIAGRNDHSIAIFQRNPASGTLTYKGRVRNGRNGVSGLKYVSDLALSRDGMRLFAAGYGENSLAAFQRDPDSGELDFLERKRKGDLDAGSVINGMKRPRGVATSFDGRTVVLSGFADNSIAIFRSNEVTHELVFSGFFKDGLNGVDGLRRALGLAFSPDGKQLYVAGSGDDAIAIFSHDAANSSVGYRGCVRDGQGGVEGLSAVSDVAVSPDGNHVYAVSAGDHSVLVFRRDQISGDLQFLAACTNGVDGVSGLNTVLSVDVSPDGGQVWAAAAGSNSVVLFDRDQASGLLTWRDIGTDGTNNFDGLDKVRSVHVSPDSRHVYAAAPGEDGVAVVARNYIPQAGNDAAGAAVRNSSLTFNPLANDVDADDDMLTVSAKTHGVLGSVSITGGGSTLTYAAGMTTGVDQFTYTISDGRGGTSTATVTVTVINGKNGVSLSPLPTDRDWNIAPNPARETATLTVNFDDDVRVRAYLTDLRGARLRTLDFGLLNSGEHSVELNLVDDSGFRLPAGTYLLELLTGIATGDEKRSVVPLVVW